MNNELMESIKRTEEKIMQVRELLESSGHLSWIPTTPECHLVFNEAKCNLNLVIKYDIELLKAWQGILAEENIYIEFKTIFTTGNERILIYGAGILEVWFYCKADDIPEELKGYKK